MHLLLKSTIALIKREGVYTIMSDRCASLCSNDISIRCVFEKGHGQLRLEESGETFECAHANPESGAYWDNGFSSEAVTVTLSADEIYALLSVLESRETPSFELVSQLIRSKLH